MLKSQHRCYSASTTEGRALGPPLQGGRRGSWIFPAHPRGWKAPECVRGARAAAVRRLPWVPRGVDPSKTFLARTWDRGLPKEAHTGWGGKEHFLCSGGRKKAGVAPHPRPHPGASITREVPQHRPVGPEAQDLLHRQVDHGVVTSLRLHLPWGAPAAFSSGAGGRQRG